VTVALGTSPHLEPTRRILRIMKRLALLFALLVTLSGSAQTPLTEKYISRGFTSRDAMLSAFFALPTDQQATARIEGMTRSNDCVWSDPWLITYRGREGEASSPNYAVATIPQENRWVIDWIGRDGVTLVHQPTDPTAAFIVIRWVGPMCGGAP
jgi:hypothetical protein